MGKKKIIIEDGLEQNWETYQPEVVLILMEKYVQIRFSKKGADALNIYRRSEKNGEWLFTATVTNSPFDDLDVEPGEKMEYRFYGVKNKNEIGIPVIMIMENLKFQAE